MTCSDLQSTCSRLAVDHSGSPEFCSAATATCRAVNAPPSVIECYRTQWNVNLGTPQAHVRRSPDKLTRNQKPKFGKPEPQIWDPQCSRHRARIFDRLTSLQLSSNVKLRKLPKLAVAADLVLFESFKRKAHANFRQFAPTGPPGNSPPLHAATAPRLRCDCATTAPALRRHGARLKFRSTELVSCGPQL